MCRPDMASNSNACTDRIGPNLFLWRHNFLSISVSLCLLKKDFVKTPQGIASSHESSSQGCVVISCPFVIADWSPAFLTLFSVVMFGISLPHYVYSSTERGVSFSGRSFGRRFLSSLCSSRRFPHCKSSK